MYAGPSWRKGLEHGDTGKDVMALTFSLLQKVRKTELIVEINTDRGTNYFFTSGSLHGERRDVSLNRVVPL